MKKLFSCTTLIIFILNFFLVFTSNITKADNGDCFVVTAYYSPLPNQNYYFKGSYDADRKLNGNGTHGASGKAVFSGMLAAPKSYPFGTKIYLEGVGIGEVADRGGAIVAADAIDSRGYAYDRIDIWMGHGEEGLKRALAWGKKTVCNSYVIADKETSVTLDVTKFPAPNSVLASLKKSEIKYEVNIFAIDIGVKSSIEETKKLHEFLASLGYYKGNVNSAYNKDTVAAVFKFQFDNKIVNSTKNNGAGIWGSETRKVALEIKNKKEALEKAKQNQKNNNSGEIKQTEEKNNISDPILVILAKNEKKSIYEDSSDESIKEIQTILKEIGVYNGEVNGKYASVKNILVDYQLKNGIIKSKNDEAAGYFGPKTNTQIKKDYLALLDKKKAEEEKENQIKLALAKVKEDVNIKVVNHMNSIGDVKEGDVGPNVRVLQQTLNMLGYFKGKDTAIFGQATRESLIAFQLEKGVIKNKDELGAGVFGPNTKETMKKELSNILETKLLQEKNLLVYKK